MIPAVVDPDIKSAAEKRLYSLLKSDPETENWTVLHSLGLARHVTQHYGEIDFVVLIPDAGIFCLEVKGGRIRCQDGIWEFQNRYGDINRRSKSPFLQARDNMFSLADEIRNHFGERDSLSDSLMGFGVLFPDMDEWSHDSPEYENWQLYDRSYRRTIGAWIAQLAQRTRQEFPNRHLPESKDLKRLVQFLRPDFDYVIPISHRLSAAEAALVRLTEEQYENLDLMELNPRAVLEGAAGTGKTLLAVEQARRIIKATPDQGVLLLCYNRLLGDWVRRRVAEVSVPARVIASSLHRFLEQDLVLQSWVREDYLKCKEAREKAGQFDLLYREDLPRFAQDALIEDKFESFDVLLVDEGQDLIHPSYLNILNDLLRGGLAGGRWGFFCDFERQALFFPGEETEAVGEGEEAESPGSSAREAMLTLLRERGNFAVGRLKVNCRNTPPIGRETALISGFQEQPFRLPDDGTAFPVEYDFFHSPEREREKIAGIIASLLQTGTPVGDIVILSPNRREKSCLTEPLPGLSVPVLEVQEGSDNPQSALRFSTIHAYKGLESSVVILIGIKRLAGLRNQRLLYVGMSRARQRLFVLLHESARHDYNDMLRRKLAR